MFPTLLKMVSFNNEVLKGNLTRQSTFSLKTDYFDQITKFSLNHKK